MKTATIRLTAPLQSYGNSASFNQRTSDSYPTKSAIVGMIAAALGYSRESKLASAIILVRNCDVLKLLLYQSEACQGKSSSTCKGFLPLKISILSGPAGGLDRLPK